MSDTIFIQDVKEAPTMSGKQRWLVNDTYGVWDQDLAQDLLNAKGQTVEAKVSVSGKYKSIMSFVVSQGGTTVTSSLPAKHSGYDNNGARVGNAVKLAVELQAIWFTWIGKQEKAPSRQEVLDSIAMDAKHLLTIMKTLERE